MPGPKQPAWIQYSFEHCAASIKTPRFLPRQSPAATLPQDVLKRIFIHATSSLPLDRQQVDVLTPFGRVCRIWRKATLPLRVLRISNRGRRTASAPEQEVPHAAYDATRLCLDVVVADRFGVPSHFETERLVKLVLQRCDRLTQLCINVASLSADALASLRMPNLVRLELCDSAPLLYKPVLHQVGDSNAYPLVAAGSPRQVLVESCISNTFATRLERLGMFQSTKHLQVVSLANRPVLEDLNFASFGSLVLDTLELRFDYPLRHDYHATKFRERLFVSALRSKPQHLVVAFGKDVAGVLVELASAVTLTTPARLSSLSVKGLASGRPNSSRAQIDVLEIRAGRHVKGKALETLVKAAGAPPSLGSECCRDMISCRESICVVRALHLKSTRLQHDDCYC